MNTNEIRELTQDEAMSVTGGLIWVHLARTAAVLLAGGVTVVREALKGEEAIVPVLDLPTPREEVRW
jgi:hypothetical protein